ncbi:MAG TPA: YciI family protein [bacterium]|nr:YciI family protein [bacterium]
MKYLCLIYNEEERLNALPRDERAALAGEALAYDEELRRTGHLIAGQALQGGETATTVRVRSGRLSTTDGPAAGAGRQLGGFLLIEARDLNEAIRLASRIPEARLGSIEIRPAKDPA